MRKVTRTRLYSNLREYYAQSVQAQIKNVRLMISAYKLVSIWSHVSVLSLLSTYLLASMYVLISECVPTSTRVLVSGYRPESTVRGHS